MPFTYSQITDIAATTKQAYNEGLYTDLTQTRQRILAKMLWEQHGKLESGSYIEWRVQTGKNSGNVGPVGYFQTDALTTANLNSTASVQFRMEQKGYQLEENILAQNSSSERKILDYAMQQYHDCETRFWEHIEDVIWGHRTADDGVTPFGLRYWMVKDHTGLDVTSDEGLFTGVNYWSGTATAGITNDYWRTYNHKWASEGETDLVAKLWMATRVCKFEPVAMQPGFGTGVPRYGLYMRRGTMAALRRTAMARNDNLGFDFGNPIPTFNGVPLEDVPALEYDTDFPVYGVDWDKTKFVFQSAMNGEEYHIANKHGQHMVHEFFKNWQVNLVQFDRRSSFLLCKTATA